MSILSDRPAPPPFGFAGPAWRFFVSGLVILALVGVVAFNAIVRLRTDASLVAHSNEVLATLANIENELAKASSARRGFVIARDSSFVQQYESARRHGDDLGYRLERLVGDNARQVAGARRLDHAADARLDEIAASMAEVGRGTRGRELLPTDSTARAVRTALFDLVSEENRTLAEREGRAEFTELAAEFVIGGGFALAFALFYMAARRSVRSALERHEADRLLAERALELDVANRQLEELLFAASGRLAEPLRDMEGLIQRVATVSAVSAPHELDAMVVQLPESVARMTRIVNDLRTYARLVAYVPARDRVPLDDLVPRVLAQMGERVQAAGGTITVSPQLPAVVGDATLLEWLLRYVLDNALTFAKPGQGPQVEISARTDNGRAVISIRDHGIGILRDYHARIFSLFERLDRHEYPGSGIGLPIAQRAAELLGTRLRVESEPGAGSTFSFDVPLMRDAT